MSVFRESNKGAFFSSGVISGLLIGAAFNLVSIDEGRGRTIEPCPENFEPSIKVTNKRTFTALASTAFNNRIQDGFVEDSSPSFNFDYATLPGELACSIVTSSDGLNSTTETVLAPAGMTALQYSNGGLDGSLPDGLQWIAAPLAK